jgi:GNAT superfamily N-acetyltransferase
MNSNHFPIFPDLALARRLELHEAWSSTEHARVQAELYPQSGAATMPIAGGYAVFCGKRSPLSEAYGLGLNAPVTTRDLDAIQSFYRGRVKQVTVRVCPLADPTLLSSLGAHGYTISDFMNVFVRDLAAEDEELTRKPGVEIRVASLEEARQWFERMGAGGDWAEPDGVSFMLIRTVIKAGARLFLAWQDGQPVAGGGLEIHEGLAALMAADTLPAYRNRGIHTDLVNARLAAAAESGCDLAVVHTDPGTISQNNVLRAGFQLVYTSARVVKALDGTQVKGSTHEY